MVVKTVGYYRVGVGKIIVQMDGINEQSPWIAVVLPGNRQDVVQSVVASRGDGKDAETVRVVAILELLVEADFPLPTLDIFLGMDSLGAIIKFNEEVELLAIRRMKLEGAVRNKGLVPAWSDRAISRRNSFMRMPARWEATKVWTMKSARQRV